MDELITVKPTRKFLEYGGAVSITHICGKEKNNAFRNGEFIEITTEEFAVLNKLGWCEEVKDVS